MILFVFEGRKIELPLFEAADNLLLHIGNEKIVTVFGTNFYKLYEEIKRNGEVHTLNLLKEWLWTKNDHSLDKYHTDDFSEIYLFFDYDIHAATSFLHLSAIEANQRVVEMLEVFNDEYEHGQLYVSFPMIEAYRYTKDMPDPQYFNYTYPVANLSQFKQATASFSNYNLDHFTKAKTKIENWKNLIIQNVCKANYLCSGQNDMPLTKTAIDQNRIFSAEVTQYVIPNNEVSVLCSLPLFIYQYLKPEILEERTSNQQIR